MSAGHREPSARRAAAVIAGSATIGGRVARILALPAVVVLVLLAVVSTQQITGYRASEATSQSVNLTLAVQGLIHELQTERGVTAGVLGGNSSFRDELQPSRLLVDSQRASVQALVRDGGAVESRVRSALQQLDGLPSVRSATDTAAAGRAAMFQYFTERIAALSNVDVGLDSASDDQLRRGASALQALEDLSEAAAQERAFLNGVFSAGGFGRGEFVQFAAMRTARDAALARFRRFATPEEQAGLDYAFDTGAARTTAYFEQVAVDAADGRHIIVNPQAWWSGLTTVLDDIRQAQRHVGSQIQLRAYDLQQAAAQRIAVLVLTVLLCLGGSVVLAVLASLSITRPLAALAEEADAVASDRLPAAVRRVQAGDDEQAGRPPEAVKVPARATREITSVASALDRLQAAAYGLATEQATQRQRTIASLANLGRRNQNLIRRQLGFITTLEREEGDPTALANLFELDHLATRMRRNAASLLVLVGESGHRRWSTPVPIADVIRAAVSEVEEYRRVGLRRVDEALVLGTAVNDVAHLLSELIENGLTFSPPDTDIEVQGRQLGDRYLIAITDQGIGMTAEELDEANARLRGEGDFVAAPTRFLGHFVVGRLAREAGIEVELVPSPVVGVTARVTLPASIMTSRVAVEAVPRARPRVDGRSPVAVLEGPGLLTARPLALSHVAGEERRPGNGPDGWPEPDVHDPAGPTFDPARPAFDPAGPTVPTVPDRFVAAAEQSGPIDLPEAAPWSPWQGRPGESAWDHWSDSDTGRQPTAAPGPGPASGPITLGDPIPASGPITLADPIPASGPITLAGAAAPPTPAGGWPATWPEPSASGPSQPPDRTRNGLRKRTPRGQRASTPPPAPAARHTADVGGAGPIEVDDSPAEVRARLMSLRAGMERGQHSPASDHGIPPR